MDTHYYYTSTALLPRLIGFIYLFVFASLLYQMKGLFGESGIQPISRYLRFIKSRLGNRAYFYSPTLFWINSSDKALLGLIICGVAISVLLLLNISPPLMLILLYILHLSVVSAGQDFLSFGWEMFLLEITANTALLSMSSPPNPIVWISLNLLLFRFYFQAGASKLLSRDPNWRNLTAGWYHYQSQPIPNIIAWFAHKLPLWFHKFSVATMFFIQLIAVLGIFGTDDMRFITFILLFGLQFSIWATGNFSYLNHMSVVLSVILISDPFWKKLLGWSVAPPEPSSLVTDSLVTAFGACLLFLQIISLWNYFSSRPINAFNRILAWVYPFHIANRYGIFAIMTTQRFEIVIEGSDDEIVWKEYAFCHKPSELNRRPRRISPLQPRLDWQVWFLPFTSYESEPWFQNFLARLLQGSPEVLKLLRHNPFPNKPPKYIRALVYEYEFTSLAEKKASGLWWKRKYIGPYSPTLSLSRHHVEK